MSRLFNHRFLRILVGLLLLFVLALSFLPGFYRYSSPDGVVNARAATIISPIEGSVSWLEPIRYGTAFEADQLMGKVINERFDTSFLFELETEKATLEKRVAIISERLQRFETLQRTLETRFRDYTSFTADQLRLLIKQEQHLLDEERAENKRARLAFDANQVLAKRKEISERILEQSEADFRRSTERLFSLELRIAELQNRLDAVNNGVFLGAGDNDVPYSAQRLDQLVIEIELARTAIAEAQARLPAMQKQIDEERQRIEKTRTFDIRSPFESIVWRLPAPDKSIVVIGSELIVLVDRNSVFLDVVLSEVQFANTSEGDTISYRLIGENEYKTGAVFAKRGSGSQLGDPALVAAPKADPSSHFRVWIAVDPDDLGAEPGNFFQVGRRVEARIPRVIRPFESLKRFFNVF
ncbi:MAG: hypothetical protein PVH47_08345 [Thiohalocapsa sp.]|jgi:multidrug resistance efflux pump